MIIHQREIGYGENYSVFFDWKKNTPKSRWSSCTIWQGKEAV